MHPDPRHPRRHPGGRDSVDLILRNRQRVRAKLESSCPALDYYYGFYITPNPDGMVCEDRDKSARAWAAPAKSTGSEASNRSSAAEPLLDKRPLRPSACAEAARDEAPQHPEPL